MNRIWFSLFAFILFILALGGGIMLRAEEDADSEEEYQKEKQSMLAMRKREPPRFMAVIRSRVYNQLRTEDKEKYEEIVYYAYNMRKKQSEFLLKHGDEDENGRLDEGECKALLKKREELLPMWFEAREKDGGWCDISDILDAVRGKAKPVTEMKEAVYDELYWKERFDKADKDKDGRLTNDEIKNEENDFGYFIDEEAFKKADVDGDAFLTAEECKKLKKEELEYFRERQNKAVGEIKEKFPDAQLTNVKWLKAHPDVVTILYIHPYWVKENYETLKALHREGQWLEDHPAIRKSIEFVWKRYDLWDEEQNEVYESLVDFTFEDKFFRNKDSSAAPQPEQTPRPRRRKEK
ncbi:MAG: hypothetical protein HY811_00310 [Planctomycetes bacterium]|nr:hypothetical protein [Planctomycetota bacterium]